MNRRGFFSTLAKAVAGFAILPAATTYARNWIPTGGMWVPSDHMGEYDWDRVLNPEWENADYEIEWAFAEAMAKSLADRSPYLNLVGGGLFPEGAGEVTMRVSKLHSATGRLIKPAVG